MALDPEVELAVARAVESSGQGKLLTKKLLACLRDMSQRELSREDTAQYLDAIRAEIVVPSQAEE